MGFSHENPEEGRHFAKQYELRWFSRHQELLAEGLDGVLICSENATHPELVALAAAAKCDILSEKPIATSVVDAEAIGRICQTNAVRFMTAFPMRFAPSTRAVRTMLRNGELGTIPGVNGINHSEIPKLTGDGLRIRSWLEAERSRASIAGGQRALTGFTTAFVTSKVIYITFLSAINYEIRIGLFNLYIDRPVKSIILVARFPRSFSGHSGKRFD